jgi:hypothetical protein
LTAEGLATKTEIDGEVSKFVDVLSKHRTAALDEITKAAGVDEQSASAKPAKKGTKE